MDGHDRNADCGGGLNDLEQRIAEGIQRALAENGTVLLPTEATVAASAALSAVSTWLSEPSESVRCP